MARNFYLFAFVLGVFILKNNNAHAQKLSKTIGLSLGFHSESCAAIDLNFRHGMNRFHFGGTYQFSGKKGDGIRNIDRMINEEEMDIKKFFYSVDVGYSRYFSSKWNIQVIVGAGEQERFYNYYNGDNWEHHILTSKTVFGAGAYAGYHLVNAIEIFAGGHSLRGFGGGVRLNIGVK